MKILNKTAFSHASILGRLNHPSHSLTHIVKATFDLKYNGIAEVAEEQMLLSGDTFYPDDEEQTGSIFYESDFAYLKPKADVLLVGKCHTPKGKPLKACVSRFTCGEYSKQLAVFGNRYWKRVLINSTTTNPQPFTEMDLRYERSFGGKDSAENPVGRGACKDDVTVAANVLPVPNIQEPDDLITSPFQKKQPAGFGPLSRNWNLRKSKMGTYNKQYLKNRWPWFPDDMDASHFNAAPEDQQLDKYLKGNETLTFENLHPEHEIYQSQLPGLRIRCFVRVVHPQTKKRSFEEVNLNLDTLWVNMEEEKLVLVWRGWMPVQDDDFDELKHVFVMAEPISKEPSSIERCYELFCQARDEEEGDPAIKDVPNSEEAAKSVNSKKLSLSAKGLTGAAAAGSSEAKETVVDESSAAAVELKEDKPDVESLLQSQVDAIFEKTGINQSELPPKVQAEIDAYKDSLVKQLAEEDPPAKLTRQADETNAALATELKKLDIDLDKLPPLSEKAKAEQIRFHGEIGIDEASMGHMGPEMENLWAIMAAVFTKIGIDPENLSPMIEHSRPQLAHTKEKLQPMFSGDGSETADENGAENPTVQEATNTDIVERAARKESFQHEIFDGMDLSGIDFNDCDLTGASFIGATLTNTIFTGAILSRAVFRSAQMINSDLSNAIANKADFTQAELSQCTASNADFSHAIFVKAKLDVGNFSHSKFQHANLASSNLNRSVLDSAVLDNADFANASLVKTRLSNVSVNYSAFDKVIAKNSIWDKASGKYAVFSQAELEKSSFLSCDMPCTDFSRANISNSQFTGSNLQESYFSEVIAPEINLSQCNLIKLRAAHGSDFTGANMSQTIADESIWSDSILVNSDFTETSLQRAILIKADLTGATFFNSNMKYANLDGVKLNNADVRYVNLMQGSLGKANLTETNFYGSNLYEVEFLDALLSETNFESANVTNTKLES